MPRRFRLKAPKQPRAAATVSGADEDQGPQWSASFSIEAARNDVSVSLTGGMIASPAELAEQLWETDYVGILLRELEQFAEISVCAASRHAALVSLRSTATASIRCASIR